MSKYTTEVRFICENYCGFDESVGFNDVAEVIENARGRVFDFDYPIFDVEYKRTLETKILKRYYTREIGAETVGLWKLWLDTRLNEIMPYYNQLYESALLEFNPLVDTDIMTTRNGKVEGERKDTGERTETRDTTGSDKTEGSTGSSSTSNGGSDNWNYYSDTPQGGINGLADLNYLTNATHNTGTDNEHSESTGTANNEREYEDSVETKGDSKNNSEFKNTEEYIEHITGKRGMQNYSKMLQEFRQTFLNIDVEIIDSLSDLFMNLW